jgi:hypothetical protein
MIRNLPPCISLYGVYLAEIEFDGDKPYAVRSHITIEKLAPATNHGVHARKRAVASTVGQNVRPKHRRATC